MCIRDRNIRCFNKAAVAARRQSMNREIIKEAFERAMRITERHLDDFVGGFPAPASENNRYPCLLYTSYEAARIEGAGAWKKFTKITVPLLKDIIKRCIVLYSACLLYTSLCGD